MPSRTVAFLSVTLIASLGSLPACRVVDPDRQAANRHRVQRQYPEAAALPAHERRAKVSALGDDVLVFASFREPGYELHLATSRDGHTWADLGRGERRPVYYPRVAAGKPGGPAEGLRDPSVAQGPDGRFHMVWTWTGSPPGYIGYASSDDLLNWSEPRSLLMMPPSFLRGHTMDACWAPELIYDPSAQHWVIAWSSHVHGWYTETDKEAEQNHRMYFTTTRDFRTFAEPRILLEPGYPVIDPAWLPHDGGYLLFFKDERQWPEKKQIRMTWGPSPTGPWREISRALSIRWVEGPSPIRLGEYVLVYFDEYREGRFGALRSDDLETWDDVTKLMRFPPGHRHGTVIRVSGDVAERLERAADNRTGQRP